MSICSNKFASGHFFVCVRDFLKQKIYILIHTRLMWDFFEFFRLFNIRKEEYLFFRPDTCQDYFHESTFLIFYSRISFTGYFQRNNFAKWGSVREAFTGILSCKN